jgi:hypothetical protein
MDENFTDNYVGQKFLFGEHIKQQLDNKVIGDIITYYEVTEVTETGSILYDPITEILEMD